MTGTSDTDTVHMIPDVVLPALMWGDTDTAHVGLISAVF